MPPANTAVRPPAAAYTVSTTTTLASAASPLTGEQVSLAVASRPVVIVKVDNSPPARPQAGLDDADVIYEERVEGSVVRFLALFQSNDSGIVGPVRSVRSTDAAIVAPLGGVFAFSGGITPFRNKVAATGVTMVIEGDKASGVSFRPGKKRPYATYADTEVLRPQAKSQTPPPALFPRLKEAEAFSAANGPTSVITGLRVVFGSLTTADWTWSAADDAWLRSTNNTVHFLEGGKRLSTNCIILQTTRYQSTPYTDRSNSPVDEAVTIGTGKALVACDGQAVEATWSKPSLKAVTTYTNAVTGKPIRIPTGRVWVSYVPTNGVITLKSPVSAATSTTVAR
jgi:hypothetical protein